MKQENAKQEEFSTLDKQEARSFLRERYLRALTSIVDKECSIQVYDGNFVTAKFGGTDLGDLKLFVKDLDSPSFKLPHALMRTSDILSITVPNASYQKLMDPVNGN